MTIQPILPTGLPEEIVERLNKEIGNMLGSPELTKYLTNEGALA